MRVGMLANSSAGPYVDRAPELPPAGVISAPASFIAGRPGAEQSAIFASSDAPPTPDRVSRFTRDSKFPLGTSVPTHRAPPPDITFGVRSKPSASAADLLHGDASRASVQSRLLALREQSTYASASREPLGQVPILGYAPTDAQQMTHGATTNFGESVKDVLYAPSDSAGGPRILANGRTVGRLGPGQQRNRGYDWAHAAGGGTLDLKSHTFGRAPQAAVDTAGDTLRGRLPPLAHRPSSHPGAAVMQSSRLATVVGGGGLPAADAPYRTVVAQRRDVHPGIRRSDPPVGKTVPRGSAPDGIGNEGRTFGRGPTTDGLSAAHIIHSGWSDEQGAPDQSVGRCLRRGPVKRVAPHAGAPTDLTAGVATVRFDKSTPALRKVTDFTTYGDSLAAGNLIAPPKYGGLGVTEEDFLKARTRDDMVGLTTAAAFNLSEEEFDFVWCSAVSVRHVVYSTAA